MDRESAVIKQKGDRHGQGEGGGLKTSKNVWTSFMDGTYSIQNAIQYYMPCNAMKY